MEDCQEKMKRKLSNLFFRVTLLEDFFILFYIFA